jgi:tetratricopeptide (TPR) repeat protein
MDYDVRLIRISQGAVGRHMSHATEPQVDPNFQVELNGIVFQWQSSQLAYNDALEAIEQLRQRTIRENVPVHEGLIENSLGIMEGYRSNLSKSTKHFEASRRIYEECGAHSRLGNSLLNIGETHRVRGNFQRARAFFQEAYESAREYNNLGTQAIALANEAQIWCSLRQYDSAYDLLLKADALCQYPWQDDEPERMTRARMGCECEVQHAFVDVYLYRQNIEDAVKHAQRGLDLAQRVGDAVIIGTANRAMGNALTALYAHDQSYNPDDYYRAATNSFNEIKAEGEVGKTLLAQGKSMAERGRKRSAAQLFQRAMEIFTRAGMTNDVAMAAEAQLSVI